MNKNVILVFGTFNPVTCAHINLSHIAKKKIENSDVYYVVSKSEFLSSWKKYDKNEIMSDDDRLRLLKESIKDIKDVYVSDIEISGLVDGKTINTVSYFKNELSYENVYLIFGTDKLSEFHTWYKGMELIRDNKFLIIQRDDDDFELKMTEYTNKYRDNFILLDLDNEYKYISSTKVRNAYLSKDFDALINMVPAPVYNYFLNKESLS